MAVIEILQQLELAPDPVGAQYRELLRPKGKLKATVAAARRFCTYLFRMLKEELTSTDAVLQLNSTLGGRHTEDEQHV